MCQLVIFVTDFFFENENKKKETDKRLAQHLTHHVANSQNSDGELISVHVGCDSYTQRKQVDATVAAVAATTVTTATSAAAAAAGVFVAADGSFCCCRWLMWCSAVLLFIMCTIIFNV